MPVKNRLAEQFEAINQTRRRVEQARDEVVLVVPEGDGKTWRMEAEEGSPFEAAGDDEMHRVRLAELPKLQGLAQLRIGDKTVSVPLYFGVGGVDYVPAAELAKHRDAVAAVAARNAELEENTEDL